MPKIKNAESKKTKAKEIKIIKNKIIKKKHFFFSIIIVILSIIVFLALFETGLRIFYPQGDIFYYEDPLLGWINPPNKKGTLIDDYREHHNEIQINSYGYREREFNFTKPESEYRILFLGDSQAISLDMPIDGRFDRIIERKLNELNSEKNTKNKQKFVTYNLGVQGYSTDQEFFTLNKIGIKLNPDLVILLFQTNDFEDNYINTSGKNKVYFDENMDLIDNTMKTRKQNAIDTIKGFLRENIQMYMFFGIRISKIGLLKNALKKTGAIENSKEEYVIYHRNPPTEMLVAENITYKIIKKMDDYSKAKGFKFLVAFGDLVPDETNLGATSYSQHVRQKTQSKDINFYRAMNNFKIFLNKEEIDYLDFSKDFDMHYEEKNTTLTYNYDPHWNPEAHKIAADAIFNKIVAEIE